MLLRNRTYAPCLFFRHWLIAAVLCLFAGISAFAQQSPQWTYETACSELTAQMEKSKEPTITALYFFRKLHKRTFRDSNEWLRTLEFIESRCRDSRGGYYAQVCTEIGHRLHGEGFYQDAYYYLYKAQTEIKLRPPKDKRFMLDFYQSLGLSYFYFKRLDASRKQFLLAYATNPKSVPTEISILNTLGLINRDQGYADSSRIYFERALALAKATSNEPWTAVLSGNLGHYYWGQKNYVKARALTWLDYTISLKTKQKGSAINALSLLIDLDLKNSRLDLAKQKLAQLESMISDEYQMQQYSVYYKAKTAVLEASGDHKGALDSYRTVVRFNDTISKQTDIENLKKTEFQINFERKQAEVSLLHEKKKRDEIIIFVLIGGTAVLVIVFGIIINLNIKRRRREKEIAALKQQQIEAELESTDKEMRQMLSNLIEKNQLIEQLTEEVSQFSNVPEQLISEEKIKMIDKLQSFTLLTDDDWLEFKKLFEKLNPSFFDKVFAHSPDLTNAEIRLITLIKLNLSNLEMSRALGISPDSVRKTSLRLRKKLNMELHEELVKFILSL
jgi:DNA-binding CsgD family transcriptional regulator